ncbi:MULTISPECIES: hypothetical protein, partial [unclassified Okeania]|uniref:hypothetical protein n=1 Tax=unclassified Okeania TaxID=2634635 RepID=UPI00257E7171
NLTNSIVKLLIGLSLQSLLTQVSTVISCPVASVLYRKGRQQAKAPEGNRQQTGRPLSKKKT